MIGDSAAVLDALPLGAGVLDDGVLAAVNAAFCQVLRADREQLIGRPLTDLLGPEETATFTARLHGATTEPDASEEVESDKERLWSDVAGVAPDGAPWIGELAVAEAVDPAHRVVLLAVTGPPIMVEGHPAEVGERAHACPWESLELDRILSHDVRGGLRGVNSFLTLLGRELGDDRTQQVAEYLDTAAAAGSRTDIMVERLVNLLRLSLRQVTLAPTPLTDLLDAAVSRSVDQLSGHAPTLEAEALPTVWASRPLLLDCLTELVTNARKFAERPITLRVSATTTGPWAYLRFDDDGPGVEPNLAEDAFLPFRLLQPKGRFPGVGMGLPLCRQITRAHGGLCRIEPHEPPGATVVLRLATAG